MKKIFLLILLLSTLNAFSQKILVEGTAFDTTNGRNWVTVILNDTINKLFADTSKKWDDYSKLWDDTNYVVHAVSNGQFKIKANKSDSLFFQSYRHIPKSYLVADLLKMDKINIKLEPQVCETYVECKDTMPKHYVFIGEKIKVDYAKEKYYCNRISMDSKFDADYKIVENIYGNYSNDTIHFVAYDHYGRPAFGNYEYVMLFVSKYCDEIFHQKYQFYNVYKTVDNKWAAPYQTSDYSRLDTLSKIKPVKIIFKTPVEFDISKASKEWVEKSYPSPYYKIENGKAIAVYGNYVPELLELKKQTVLKARNIVLN
jgi:hypothetical protein